MAREPGETLAAAEALFAAVHAACVRLQASAPEMDPEKTGKAALALCRAFSAIATIAATAAAAAKDDDVETLRASLRDRLARYVAAHRPAPLPGEPGRAGGEGDE